jgi:UDP-N-acetylglucosamine--N-acetylmuramyl-(pentapeptide) pyrophosphoryl-undecaprenol N-acetylglucosamine transferase
VVFAATTMRVPTLIQDQNSAPGVTTRMLASRVNEVHLTFDRARKSLKRQDNVFVTGNPTRDSLDGVSRDEALKFFGFDASVNAKTILAFGGSLGARTINEAVAGAMTEWIARGYRVIWQTGPGANEELKSRFAGVQNVRISPFIDRMDFAYAAADLVVCRAGATTIAELTRLGKVSILIPYPFAAANHQVENAKVLVDAGAAKMIVDGDALSMLPSTVTELLDNAAQLAAMGSACRAFGKPNAARVLAERVTSLARLMENGK